MENLTEDMKNNLREYACLSVKINNDILHLIEEESEGKLFYANEKISEGIQEVLKYWKDAK